MNTLKNAMELAVEKEPKIPHTHTVARLLNTGPFEFDLIDKIKNITNNYLAERVLSSIAFACDGRISSRIASEVKRVRVEREAIGEANWDSYSEFLTIIEGIVYREQFMIDAGMEVEPLKEHLQKLLTMREYVWDIYEERFQLGSQTWIRPHVTDLMLNPRIRQDDTETLAKSKMLLDFRSVDDDGVLNIELRSDMEQAMLLKDAVAKREALKWDKVRGKLYAQFFNTLDLSDEKQCEDPFGDLPDEDQQLMLDRMLTKYVPGALERMKDDRMVTTAELGSAMYEARGFLKEVKAALAHPKFRS